MGAGANRVLIWRKESKGEKWLDFPKKMAKKWV
jgi:hypothetical protein